MCPMEDPDCVDADLGGDEFDLEGARAEARRHLGEPEDALNGAVRVGRRGAEQMMLTEDHVPGRLTVELDEDDTGTYRVTSVTVETPDGAETFTS